MLGLLKLLLGQRNSKYQATSSSTAASSPSSASGPANQSSVSSDLTVNLRRLTEQFNLTPDLVIRRLQMDQAGTSAALVYLEGLVDKVAINNNIVQEIIRRMPEKYVGIPEAVSVGDYQIATDWIQGENAILQGNSVLFVNGEPQVYVFDTKGWPKRAIEDSHVETALRGAHQAFVETGSQNIALIRRYIANRELKIKEKIVGERGQTRVSILYLSDVANPDILQELETRIAQVNVDAILNTGELAEYIEDNSYSPFPQFLLTERPDTVASHILQGRFAVVVDRTPTVLIAPAIFVSFFQSVDDYSNRWIIASFVRLLRFMALLIAMFLPGLYIALISFNYEVIPVQLILSIAETRSRVPFPPIMEAILMEIALEMMREAGIRLPAPIGQTVGIVGGIIIGQAAVQAGIVSNFMVIVVALTAIASFIIPNYDMGASIRLLRFPMMLLASLFGIVGIVCGAIAIVAHFVSLESLGTPYGSPLSPWRFKDLKDVIIRMPLWTMSKRPENTKPLQAVRQRNSPKPEDP